MPGFKPAAKSGGKAGGKSSARGHATSGKGSGGCGTGAGGFKPGNTCGHKGNRNQNVEEARAAHTAAKAEVLAHVKAHRKASKAAAKSGEKAAHPKELHAALKKAAAAHGALKAARDTHRENKKAERNAARREAHAVKSGKASPIDAKPAPPTRTGQAKPPSTDKGTPADRLGVAAARHRRIAGTLHKRADDLKRQADQLSGGVQPGRVAPPTGGSRGRGLGGAPVAIGGGGSLTRGASDLDYAAGRLAGRARHHGARALELEGAARKAKASKTLPDASSSGENRGMKSAKSEQSAEWKPRPDHDFPDAPSGAHREHDEWARKLDDKQTQAVLDYAQGDHQQLNGFSRDPHGYAGDYSLSAPMVAKVKERVATLDAALSKAHAASDMTVYRGMRSDGLQSMGVKVSDLRPGAVFETGGFTSTSTGKRVGQRFSRGEILMTIRVPKGTPGAHVNAVRGIPHPEESEFLMPTTVRRYRVVKTIDHGQGEHEIVVEVDHGH